VGGHEWTGKWTVGGKGEGGGVSEQVPMTQWIGQRGGELVGARVNGDSEGRVG